VMVSAALNVTRTWDYSVMEGGRVRMIVPGGETIVFKCAVDRRSLVLDPESPGMVSRNQFVRLENQTLAEAHRARQQEAAKQQEAMLEQVRELVKRPNLVLESSDPSLRLSRYALELKGGPDQFEGVAWTESNPPVMRQAGLWVQQGRPPQVLIVLGSVLGPPGEADRQHIQIRLTPRGEGSKLELEEKGLALRSNEKVHAEIVKGYDTIIAEREAALAKALEPFGAYARFETEFYTSNAPNARPVPAKFALWRVKGKPQFRVADLRRKSNPAEAQFNMTADAIVYAGKLLVSCPQMQFEMEPVSAGGKLALKGGFGGWEVQVPAVEVLSEAELKERAEAVKAFVDRDLARGMTLRGWMVSDRDHIKNLHQPLSLVMKCDAQHKLSGTLKMLSHSSEFEMQGDITPAMTGASIAMNSTKLVPNPQKRFSQTAFQGASVNLDVLWQDGHPTYSGIKGGPFVAGPAGFEPVSKQTIKAERKRLEEILAAGAKFIVTGPASEQPMVFDLKADPKTGQITGQTDAGACHSYGSAKITGQIDEADGFVRVILRHDNGMNARNRPTSGGEHVLWLMIEEGDRVALAGYTCADGINPPNVYAMRLDLVK
jgi:hypothetical protein